jgi:hypothetical protein
MTPTDIPLISNRLRATHHGSAAASSIGLGAAGIASGASRCGAMFRTPAASRCIDSALSSMATFSTDIVRAGHRNVPPLMLSESTASTSRSFGSPADVAAPKVLTSMSPSAKLKLSTLALMLPSLAVSAR